MTEELNDSGPWPALPWAAWEATAATLHMWTQIVGKTRLALTPLQNHWWNVPLYVTARGLGTSAMPCGDGLLEIEFDFVTHALHLRPSYGDALSLPLRAQSVAAFYGEYEDALRSLGIVVPINPMPVELARPIRFDLDTVHASYDPEYAHRFWQILARANTIFHQFGTEFLGKVSPVHFFWGSFDLAVTRFSGRPAPPREGVDGIQREAYSHEVISAGFWPGNGGYGAPAFYCYAAPVPEGMSKAVIRPDIAHFDTVLGEFLLPYEALREQSDPDAAVLEFLQSAYSAAADLAGWDRVALERHAGSRWA